MIVDNLQKSIGSRVLRIGTCKQIRKMDTKEKVRKIYTKREKIFKKM